jgi:hypothetical protein
MIRIIMQSSNATLRNLKSDAMVKRPVEPQSYSLRDANTMGRGKTFPGRNFKIQLFIVNK